MLASALALRRLLTARRSARIHFSCFVADLAERAQIIFACWTSRGASASTSVNVSATEPVFHTHEIKTQRFTQEFQLRDRERNPHSHPPVTTRPAVCSTNLEPAISYPYSDKSRPYHSQEVGCSKMSAVRARQQRRHLGRVNFPKVHRLEMNVIHPLTSPQKSMFACFVTVAVAFADNVHCLVTNSF